VLKSPEWLDPDPWVAKPMEASKLTEAVVETSMEAFMEVSKPLFPESISSKPTFAESISSKPLFAEPMTSEHVTSEPLSPTPRMPEPRTCQEQHRRHDEDAHPLLPGSHSPSFPCIMRSVLDAT
jgi:hypothetical protein